MIDEKKDDPLSPDIPDDIVGPVRTLLQMFRMFVDPEAKRRGFEFPIIKAQVLFFEDRPPEVRLNDEVKISLLIRAPRAVEKGEAVSVSEIEQHYEGSELDVTDADAGHFTAVAINGKWLMTFDFRPNKLTAAKLVKRAGEFCVSAEHALSQQHFGPAIDNLYSACELAAKARLITSAMLKSDAKKHGTIHSGINQWGKLGNVDREFVETFNQLTKNREPARYTGKDDLSINPEMITKVRAEIAKLQMTLKRFGDQSS
jgi:uncharacterized protein (UPF0332 family)